MATAANVFRDYETDGVPSSGAKKPKKSEIRQLLAGYESIINAFISNGGLVYGTKAQLDADLAHGANSMAWVLGDATVANNGIYRKIGGSGTGSWTRVADLPFSFIIASDVGAGTANAIQATTSIPVSSSALIWMNIFEANTSTPVTVSFNGGSALTIKTNSGNNPVIGGLVAGMIVMGIVSGSTFRLVSDQASAAVLAAAVAAKDAAEAAQAAAEAAAATAEAIVGFDGSAGTVQYNNNVSGSEGGNVQAAIDSLETGVQVSAERMSAPFIVDAHFGVMRGLVCIPTQITGSHAYTVTTPASAGDWEITFAGFPPQPGELFVIKGVDGQYYTIGVKFLTGQTAFLTEELPVNVAAGANAFVFWLNFSHMTGDGAKAYVDHFMRQRPVQKRLAYRCGPFSVVGDAAMVPFPEVSGFNPGSQDVPAWWVTPNAAGTGVRFRFNPRKTGKHVASIRSPRLTNSGTDLTVQVRQGTSGVVIQTMSIGALDAVSKNIQFTISTLDSVEVWILGESDQFLISEMDFYEQSELVVNWNRGTHAVIGDSWVAVADGPAVRLAERLPNATVVKSGVSGNTAAMLLTRFYSDVAPLNPDFVHIIIGTNDYATGVSPAEFGSYLSGVVEACFSIGAVPIVYTASTGAYAAGGSAANFNLSRRYLNEVAYWPTERKITRHTIGRPVANGLTPAVLSLGRRFRPFRVIERNLSHDVGVYHGPSQPVSSGGALLAGITAGANDAPITFHPTVGYYVQLYYSNTTGSAVELAGYLDIEED
ncbi:hypothetical protein N185_00075 [Sinorhizobium sp. GW3]|nr:hypothetical protein N185_00075 [Sinorhizobium sp. GW3]